MATAWKTEDRLRFDPYLDWEAQLVARAEGAGVFETRWCPVYIELKPSNGDGTWMAHYRTAVEWLRAAVKKKSAEDTTVADRPASLYVSQLEHNQIANLEAMLHPDTGYGDKTPAQTARVRFFIYRPEDLIYDPATGAYRSHPRFRVVFAGPPIAGFQPPKTTKQAGESGTSINRAAQVAIGIIDDGVAFGNARFRWKNGHKEMTRIQSVWLQEMAKTEKDGEVAIGAVYTGSAIDTLLNQYGSEAALYRKMDLTDHRRAGHKPLAFRRSHGTFCLDIAAGGAPETASINVNPLRSPRQEPTVPIFAVQLPTDAVADVSGATVGSYVLQGVRHIMQEADAYRSDIPLILNFSYGVLAGPKDGSHPLEMALADMIEAREGETTIVMSAGNSRLLRANARMTLANNGGDTLDWLIQPDDKTPNFVEIWIDGAEAADQAGRISLTLTPPGGLGAGTLVLDADKPALLFHNGRIIAMMTAQRGLGANGTRIRAFLAIGPSAARHYGRGGRAPCGRWSIGLANASGGDIDARLYIQRDGTPAGYPHKGRASRFDHKDAYRRSPETGNFSFPGPDCPIQRTDTISAIATGAGTIVVGALRTTEDGNEVEPSHYASRGPCTTGKDIDYWAIADLVAGGGMIASGTYSGSATIMNGTSVAAPQVVRLLAAKALGDTASKAPDGTNDVAKVIDKTESVYVRPLKAGVMQRRRRGLDFADEKTPPPSVGPIAGGHPAPPAGGAGVVT